MSAILIDSDRRLVIAQKILTNIHQHVYILKSESVNHTDEIAMLNIDFDHQENHLLLTQSDIQSLEIYIERLNLKTYLIEMRLEELEGYP